MFSQIPQILAPSQQESVVVEFDWSHPIARLAKPPVRCKHLADISYIS